MIRIAFCQTNRLFILQLQAEKEIRHLTQKLHVQIENKPRSPRSETIPNICPLPGPHCFSFPSTFNIHKINMPSSLHTSNVGSELGAFQRQGRFVVGSYVTENTTSINMSWFCSIFKFSTVPLPVWTKLKVLKRKYCHNRAFLASWWYCWIFSWVSLPARVPILFISYNFNPCIRDRKKRLLLLVNMFILFFV